MDTSIEGMKEKLEAVANKLSREDVPRLVKNITALSVAGMTIYTLGVALSAMMPSAIIAFGMFGYIFGLLIPLLMMFMTISMVIGVAKILLR